MLIKKDEEPFFYKFLSIAKEIIRKNKRYTPVFYGDDEKLYLVCHNYAAVYDFQSNLLLDDELRELLLEWGEDNYLPLQEKIKYLENENYRLRMQNLRIKEIESNEWIFLECIKSKDLSNTFFQEGRFYPITIPNIGDKNG